MREHARYLLVFATVFVSVLAALASYHIYWDPYWLWRDQPPWASEWKGHNRALDIRHRYAKAMQLVTRRPELVVLGSSRVYRGIDTGRVAGGDAFNLGISSLRVREARAFAEHAVRWAPVKRMLLGLDFFMFDANKPWQTGFDANLARVRYLFDALPIALFTRTAFDDTRRARAGEHQGDGYWARSGFKHTNPRNRKQLDVILDGFYREPAVVTRAEYEALAELIGVVQRAGVAIDVFISPMNQRQIEHIERRGLLAEFNRWRANTARVLAAFNLPLHDFSLTNPFFDDEVSTHSTRHWIDTSHYSPEVGNWILSQLGVVIRAVQ